MNHTLVPVSPRAVLPAKVVRPPSGEVKRCRPPVALVHSAAVSGVRATTLDPPMLERIGAGDAPTGTCATSRSPALLRNDTLGEDGTAAFQSVVSAAVRESGQAGVASWPAMTGTPALVDVLGRLLRAMDKETSPILRANGLIECFRALGSEMRTFEPFFRIFSAEVQRLVGWLADAREETKAALQDAMQAKESGKAELRSQHTRLSHEIRGLSQELQDRRDQMLKFETEHERFLAMQAELERDRKLFAMKEQELNQTRRIQEQMSIQFAQRNKTLQDSIPPLEEEAKLQRQRAEELQHINQRLANKISTQERVSARTIHNLEATLERSTAAQEELTAHNRRLASSIQALRVVKDQLSEEVRHLKAQMADMESLFDRKLRSMTPRPEYETLGLDALWAGDSKNATAERMALLASHVAKLRAHEETLVRENAVYRETFFLSNDADSAGTLSPSALQLGMAELLVVPSTIVRVDDDDAMDPSGSGHNGHALPPMLAWPQGVPRITCKACTLQEAVMRARELMDHCTMLQNSTTRHVELNMSMLVFFLDGHAMGEYSKQYGKYPPIPPSETNKTPMSVYEHAMMVVRAADVWAAEPVLRTFSVIVREEVGPWFWAYQKQVVSDVVAKLSGKGGTTLGQCLQLIAEQMDSWPVSTVLAVQRALRLHLTQSSRGPSSSSSSQHRRSTTTGNSLAKRQPHAGGSDALVDLNQVVALEPEQSSSVLENLFVRRFRMILLETVLGFYNRLESRVLAAAFPSQSAAARLPFDVAAATVLSMNSVVDAVQNACPSIDLHTAQQFVAEVHDLASTTLKLEAVALRASGGAPPEYHGPSEGSAASQLFVSGLQQHYFGSVRPYPKLLTVSSSANRPQRRARGERGASTVAFAQQRKSVVASAPASSTAASAAPAAPAKVPRRAKEDSVTETTPGTSSIAVGGGGGGGNRLSSKNATQSLPLLVWLRMLRKVHLPPGFATICDGPADDT